MALPTCIHGSIRTVDLRCETCALAHNRGLIRGHINYPCGNREGVVVIHDLDGDRTSPHTEVIWKLVNRRSIDAILDRNIRGRKIVDKRGGAGRRGTIQNNVLYARETSIRIRAAGEV